MSGILKAVVLLSLPAVIMGSCQYADMAYTKDDGTIYCKRYNSNIEMEVGEWHLDTENCFNCSCSTVGLGCCVYGIMAGHMGVSDECQVVMLDNCNYRLARADNEDKDC